MYRPGLIFGIIFFYIYYEEGGRFYRKELTTGSLKTLARITYKKWSLNTVHRKEGKY